MDISADAIAVLALLIGLELVLGVDNILVIAILVSRLPAEKQNSARMFGLLLALGIRIVMVCLAVFLIKLQNPIWPHLDDGENAGAFLKFLAHFRQRPDFDGRWALLVMEGREGNPPYRGKSGDHEHGQRANPSTVQ